MTYEPQQVSIELFVAKAEDFFSQYSEDMPSLDDPTLRDWLIYVAAGKGFLPSPKHISVESSRNLKRPGWVDASLSKIGSLWAMSKGETQASIRKIERRIMSPKGMSLSTEAWMETMERFRRFLFDLPELDRNFRFRDPKA